MPEPNDDGVVKDYRSEYETRRLTIIRQSLGRIAERTKTAIELGCHDGTITAELAGRFGRVVAIDCDAVVLKEARAKVKADHIDWRLHDLNQRFPREFYARFDAVVALEVIEHLDRPEQFLGESWQCLKPGGRLLLSTPNLLSLDAFTGMLWAIRTGESYTAWDPTHKKLFRSGQILRLIRRAGFQPRRIIGYHYHSGVFPLIRKSIMVPLVSSSRWPLNRFGFNLIVEAARNNESS